MFKTGPAIKQFIRGNIFIGDTQDAVPNCFLKPHQVFSVSSDVLEKRRPQTRNSSPSYPSPYYFVCLNTLIRHLWPGRLQVPQEIILFFSIQNIFETPPQIYCEAWWYSLLKRRILGGLSFPWSPLL